MLRVYIETTIPGYLTAKPSRDILLLARQELTCEWWNKQRYRHQLFVSELVLIEAGAGSREAARKRSDMLIKLPVLENTEEAYDIAATLMKSGCLPRKAEQDAAHVGLATAHQMDVLLTWNCTHLANPVVMKKMIKIIRGMGYEPPQICTSLEMMGGK